MDILYLFVLQKYRGEHYMVLVQKKRTKGNVRIVFLK